MNKEDEVALAWVLYMYYPLHFWKNNKNKVQALINFGNKVNAMTPAIILKIGLWVCRIDIGIWKIDDSTLKMFKIVLASFKVEDKFEKAWFFWETFLLANTSKAVIFRRFFLAFSNTNIRFLKNELT